MCRIELSDDEKRELSGEMDSILDFVNQIQTAEVGDKKESVGILKNVMREDKNPHKSELYTEDILREAPKIENGYIKVKKIL